jgi:hypothetical protein
MRRCEGALRPKQSPLSPGRRSLRFARNDIKECPCGAAARLAKHSPRLVGDCFAWGCISTHARNDIKECPCGAADRLAKHPPLAWQEIASPGGASAPTLAKTCAVFCVYCTHNILNDMQSHGNDHPLISMRGVLRPKQSPLSPGSRLLRSICSLAMK